MAEIPEGLRDEIVKRAENAECFLCAARPAAVCLMCAPDDPTDWGYAPGTNLAVAFALCAECAGREGAVEEAEAIIHHRMNARNN